MADHQVREDSGSRPSAIVQQTLDVLVVERASGHATTVEQLLAEARGAMLARRGTFTVTQADCMAEALSQLRRRRFSVVLLDLQFPGDCGLDSLEQIRLTASETPVIVLAGTDDDGMALRAISAGAQDFLPKEQLEARLLVRTIFNAVERKRVETQLRRRTRDLEKAHARIKQQAAELERRNDELDRINGELEEFTYIASHDLKEPLRGIRAYCEIIREDYGPALDEEGERRLEKMGELCRRLETLIADLLTYCRVGGATPTTSTVDLDLVVADVLDMLRPAIEARNAVVRVDGPLPCVTGDAMLLGLAMANLVSNGLKFNRSERPTVEIGTASGQQPIVYVRDNGIGIDPRYHEAVFAMFRRLHGRQDYEGSGAGLAIVKKIAETTGGRVWLESSPDRGATFYLALPPAVAAVAPFSPPHWNKVRRSPDKCRA